MANNTSAVEFHGIPEPYIGEPLYPATRVVLIVIGSVMILSAVVGNPSLIAVVIKDFLHSRKKRLQHLFLVNLALSDIFILGFWFIYFVLDLVLGYHPIVNMAHCVANGMVAGVSYVACVTFLLSISFNRYLYICHSHLYKRFFTLPRTVCWCVLIWIIVLILAIPPLWGGRAGSYHFSARTHACSYDRTGITYLKIATVVFSSVFPFITAYLNFSIFRFWKRQSMSEKARYPMMNRKQKKRRNLMARWRTKLKKKAVPDEAGTAPKVDKNVTPCSSAFEAETESVDLLTVATKDGDTMSTNPTGNQPSQRDGVCAYETERSSPDLSDETEQYSTADESSSDSNTEDTEATLVDSTINSDSNTHESVSAKLEMLLSKRFDGGKSSQIPNSNISGRDSAFTTPTVALPKSATPTYKKRPHSRFSKSSVIRKLQEGRKKGKSREVAFVRSLLVVCVLNFVCYLPYVITVILESVIETPPDVPAVGVVLVLFNNSVNWLVYGVMNRTFRKSYGTCLQKIINMCFRDRKRAMSVHASSVPEV